MVSWLTLCSFTLQDFGSWIRGPVVTGCIKNYLEERRGGEVCWKFLMQVQYLPELMTGFLCRMRRAGHIRLVIYQVKGIKCAKHMEDMDLNHYGVVCLGGVSTERFLAVLSSVEITAWPQVCRFLRFQLHRSKFLSFTFLPRFLKSIRWCLYLSVMIVSDQNQTARQILGRCGALMFNGEMSSPSHLPYPHTSSIRGKV